MKNKKISIMIPAFNAEKNIRRCIESILNEEKNDEVEIVVVNDFSTDNTLNILNEYKEKYNNIRVINNEQNYGVSKTRNIGIANSKGEYIIMIDADDYINKGLLKLLIEEIQKEKNDIFRYKAVVKNDMSKKHPERFNIDNTEEILTGEEAIINWSKPQKQYAVPWIYCIKKDIYNDVKFLEGVVHEDFGTIPLLILKAKTIKMLDFIGYNYIKNETGITSLNNENNEVSKAKDYLKQYDFLVENINQIYKDNIITNNTKKFILNEIKYRMPEKLRYLKQNRNKILYIAQLYKRGIFVLKGIT